jgi:hypothetical protein
MRIVSFPNLRIAAGLLLAALLSIVGDRIFRRWISHGPEALLERADDLTWLVSWDLPLSIYRGPRQELIEPNLLSWVRCPSIGRIPALIEISSSIPFIMTK